MDASDIDKKFCYRVWKTLIRAGRRHDIAMLICHRAKASGPVMARRNDSLAAAQRRGEEMKDKISSSGCAAAPLREYSYSGCEGGLRGLRLSWRRVRGMYSSRQV
jgi:hypothetical protein